mgnify:CR=1 FL=1
MGLFSGKKSKEKLLQDFTRSNMSPQLANIAYAKYANNGEIHNAAQALSKEQIEECYQAAFLLFLKKLKNFSFSGIKLEVKGLFEKNKTHKSILKLIIYNHKV